MSGLMLGPILLQTIVGQTTSPATGIPTRADRKGIVLSLSSEQIDAAFNFYTGDQFCDFMNKSVRELAPLLAKAILSSGFSYSINFEGLPRELQEAAIIKLVAQMTMSPKSETSLLALYTEQNPRSGGKSPRDLVCGTNTKSFNGYPGRWTPGPISIEGITLGMIEQIIIDAGQVSQATGAIVPPQTTIPAAPVDCSKVEDEDIRMAMNCPIIVVDAKIVPAGADSESLMLNLIRDGWNCGTTQPTGDVKCTRERIVPDPCDVIPVPSYCKF